MLHFMILHERWVFLWDVKIEPSEPVWSKKMKQSAVSIMEQYGFEPPDISHIEIEDGKPVESLPSERGSRLLVEPIYTSWEGPGDGRPFVAAANVGVFFAINEPPYVPDVFLSLDVDHPLDLHEKQNRTYMAWVYGKLPDVVIEIVSNRVGNELVDKKRGYARLRIPYYIVHDPEFHLGRQELYVFELQHGNYVELKDGWLSQIGLGVRLWQGEYEGMNGSWLRWCDIDGALLPTGAEAAQEARTIAQEERERTALAVERADFERERAEQEMERAEQERVRAEQERERAERLAAKLRELGLDPTQI